MANTSNIRDYDSKGGGSETKIDDLLRTAADVRNLRDHLNLTQGLLEQVSLLIKENEIIKTQIGLFERSHEEMKAYYNNELNFLKNQLIILQGATAGLCGTAVVSSPALYRRDSNGQQDLRDRDLRDSRDGREKDRDSRDSKDSRDSRDSKDSRDLRDSKDSRDGRGRGRSQDDRSHSKRSKSGSRREHERLEKRDSGREDRKDRSPRNSEILTTSNPISVPRSILRNSGTGSNPTSTPNTPPIDAFSFEQHFGSLPLPTQLPVQLPRSESFTGSRIPSEIRKPAANVRFQGSNDDNYPSDGYNTGVTTAVRALPRIPSSSASATSSTYPISSTTTTASSASSVHQVPSGLYRRNSGNNQHVAAVLPVTGVTVGTVGTVGTLNTNQRQNSQRDLRDFRTGQPIGQPICQPVGQSNQTQAQAQAQILAQQAHQAQALSRTNSGSDHKIVTFMANHFRNTQLNPDFPINANSVATLSSSRQTKVSNPDPGIDPGIEEQHKDAFFELPQ